MVVLGSYASAIDGLSFVVPEDVEDAARSQCLQRAVNRREPYPLAVGAKPIVDLLSGEERVGVAQRVQDRNALRRLTTRGVEGGRGHLAAS
jgi:hypothetical protein